MIVAILKARFSFIQSTELERQIKIPLHVLESAQPLVGMT